MTNDNKAPMFGPSGVFDHANYEPSSGKSALMNQMVTELYGKPPALTETAKVKSFKAWHVSPYHIVAAESSDAAICHARSIGLEEAEGLYLAALELALDARQLPCSTGDNQGNAWRDGTIRTFLAEVSETRLLCEVCPRTS